MATQSVNYANSAAISITLNGLTDGSARESDAIDNTSNQYLDALVNVTVTLTTGTPDPPTAEVKVYVYGSEDGTNYGDNATGSDAAITLRSPSNFKLLGSIATPDADSLTYISQPMSVARAFGGWLPRKWGLIVVNNSGFDLDSSGNSVTYTGLKEDVA